MKTKLSAILSIIFGVILIVYIAYDFLGIRPSVEGDVSDIILPDGFAISVFADNLGSSSIASPGPNNGPRFMVYYEGVLLVSLTKQGKVVALPDRDNNGIADEMVIVVQNLNNPHGLAVHNDELYIAEENRLIKGRLKELVLDEIETVAELPAGGGHFTRTIVIDDDALYVSVGSSCNVCYQQDNRRASVLKCTLEGECQIFASGLRNSVGLAFNPETNELWGTDNGRDLIGNSIPPEEINIIKEKKDYGWPICYGNRIHDTDFDKNVYIRNPCEDTEAPVFEIAAHSAPLGLAFYNGDMFPEEYDGDLFVAYHGSWNRQPPTGYKVVRLKIENSLPVSIQDFAAGWLDKIVVKGRPVDIIVATDGALLVSDDNRGKIYRISYEK